MNNNYAVYAHKFPNDMYYIGITRQDPKKRWGFNGSGYRKQPVYDEIQKWGWENIEHIILYSHLSVGDARSKERELILLYDSINNGYNVSYGGGIGSDSWCEFEYNGIIYTAEELASMSIYDISAHDITTRVNHHGWSIDRAINTPKGRKNVKFNYNGNNLTIKQLYNIRINKSITYEQLKNRLLKHNWDVYRAITQPSNIKLQPSNIGEKIYEYDGRMYSSYELCQISKVDGLRPADITTRINQNKWSVEKAITTPKKRRNQKFVFNNKEYTSKELAEMSPFNDITYHDITDRINRNGWTVEKAVYTPKRKSS